MLTVAARMKVSFALVLVFSSCTTGSDRSRGERGFNPSAPVQVAEAVEAAQLKRNPAAGTKVAVATQGPATTAAVQKVLEAGGNFIDAFVVASLMLSVERPHSTGLTGGGFLIYREAKTKKVYAFDFRERAPLKATRTMFLDKSGEFRREQSQDSVRAAAVPGLVAGIYEIHQRFGSKPWSELVQPAIELAEQGFPIYAELEVALEKRKGVLEKDPAARKIFLHPKGHALKREHILVQQDLGKTLRAIAKEGKDGFYKGPVAEKFLSFMKSKGGLITKEDFEAYKVLERMPVKAEYRGYDLYSMSPPSSGGVLIANILNILEGYDLAKMGYMTSDSVHAISSAFQLAFADRTVHLGDPDFHAVPVGVLTSKEYAKKRRALISKDRALKKAEVKAGDVQESTQTTHFSFMDQEGNAIASTQTINGWMGSGIVVPGTGMLLNNEMDDFAAKPGAANLFGALGGDANAVAPKKTPLSSMSPTLLMKDGKVEMVIGAPGGTRIITCVAQTIINWLDFNMTLKDAVSSVRFHHQWSPDELNFDEPGPSADLRARLEAMGYTLNLKGVPCYVLAVAREGKGLSAVADPRDVGLPWAK